MLPERLDDRPAVQRRHRRPGACLHHCAEILPPVLDAVLPVPFDTSRRLVVLVEPYIVLPVGSEFGSSGLDSSGPFEMVYDSSAASPSRGCPVIHSAWLAQMRSHSPSSVRSTVHVMFK